MFFTALYFSIPYFDASALCRIFIKYVTIYLIGNNKNRNYNMGKNKDGNYEGHNSNNVFPNYETCDEMPKYEDCF